MSSKLTRRSGKRRINSKKISRKLPRKRKSISFWGSSRVFVSSRTSGITGIWRVERLLPLNNKAIAGLHQFVREQRRQHRRFKHFYASLYIETVGPLYESKGFEPDRDEHHFQWLNTGVVQRVDRLIDAIDLLLDKIDLLSFGRFAKLRKLKLTFFNVTKIPNSASR